MNAILYASIIAVAVLSIFDLHISVFATQLNLTDSMTNDFAKNLKSKINNLVTNALNDTSNVLNSSLLINESNQTSNNVVVSQSSVQSTMRSKGSSADDSISIIKDKVTRTNGVCNSEKVSGNGNDTLYSSGNCNDMLTGGLGADKFTCGEGNDTIRDYNSKEGDVILDRQNCEEIF
jgi:Ca2+-binding RTX toxin-like protein